MTDVGTTQFENDARSPLGKSRLDTDSSDPFDRCVVCGCLTEFHATDPVENRLYYIDGAGQLCSSCGRQLYPCGM